MKGKLKITRVEPLTERTEPGIQLLRDLEVSDYFFFASAQPWGRENKVQQVVKDPRHHRWALDVEQGLLRGSSLTDAVHRVEGPDSPRPVPEVRPQLKSIDDLTLGQVFCHPEDANPVYIFLKRQENRTWAALRFAWGGEGELGMSWLPSGIDVQLCRATLEAV